MTDLNNCSVSLIIPNFNGQHLLAKHLPAVKQALRKNDEIVVVDDASTDNSLTWLQQNHSDIKIVKHSKNQRFAAAVNSGVKAAKNDIILLLNNDVSPQKNFLNPLLTHFQDKQIFAVGCQEVQTINGKKFTSGRSLGKFSRGFLIHWRASDQNQNTTLWAAGGSMAARKTIWHQLKGIDTIYNPAYWEDIDISYRALKKGYKVVFEPQSIVYHHHQTTNIKELGNLLMKLSAYKNQFIFVWKNISDINLLIQHLIWLPYHLLFTTVRSGGLFLLGFLWALIQLPQALSRRLVKHKISYSDSAILAKYTH